MKLSPREQWALNASLTELIAQGEVEVEYEARPVRTTFTVELSPDDLEWLCEEASRRGVNPLEMIRILVSQARRAAQGSPEDQNAGEAG